MNYSKLISGVTALGVVAMLAACSGAPEEKYQTVTLNGNVEMQAGPSTFVPLSDSFEIKKKIKEVFANLKTNLKAKLIAKLRLKPKKSDIDNAILDEEG